jgi:hypothetical protein
VSLVVTLKDPFNVCIDRFVENNISNNELFDKLSEASRLKNKERIDTIKKLTLYIIFFNELVFSEQKRKSVHIAFYKKRHRFDFIASYYHPCMGSCEFEIYGIYIPGTKIIKERKVISFDKNGVMIPDVDEYKDVPNATKEEQLMSIAAHEVRHRLQYNIMVLPITGNNFFRNEKLNSFIKYNQFDIGCKEEIYRENNGSEEFIKSRINNKEFDASLIELIVLSQIHNNESVENVLKTLRMSM